MNYILFKNKYIKELEFIYKNILILHLKSIIKLQPHLKTPSFESFCKFSYTHTKFPYY